MAVNEQSDKLGPREWDKIRKRSRTGKKQWERRLIASLSLGVLAFEIAVSVMLVRADPWAGLAFIALAAILLGLAVRFFRIGFAQLSLDDRAAIEYGMDFSALNHKQRGYLFQRAVRDGLFGRVKVDEHEAEQRLRAQGAAYRLLGPALLVFVTGYWAACLFGPFAATRSALAVTAVVVTWLAALVLAAPTMIRMWTQPDDPEETAAVAE
jgi:hypothetical protein